MFFAIATILIVLWVMGLVSGAALGPWVHVFLVMALISSVIALARGAPNKRSMVRGRPGMGS